MSSKIVFSIEGAIRTLQENQKTKEFHDHEDNTTEDSIKYYTHRKREFQS